MTDVLIIGGGLAGLVSSIELAQRGYVVVVVERKMYPFHRVCGEYVSNEVRPYLEKLGLKLDELGVKEIQRFQFTSPSGRALETDLDLGGFGISRYTLDFALFELAKKNGVEFILGETVENVEYADDEFKATTINHLHLSARIVLGSFGKNSRMDKALDRDFTHKKSPYVGVKYHIRTEFPQDLITLHNFQDGYCGISAIEDDRYCLCYLTTRNNIRKHGSIADMEREVLWKNPHLKRLFNESEFIFERPEVINEFSFEPKQVVENHILMVGDAAGLITPLCGNGMAMAIHGGKIAAVLAVQFLNGNINRQELEKQYKKAWKQEFAARLWVGRNVQKLFGDAWLSEIALSFFGLGKPLLRFVIKNTHGKPIE
ncbi:FAD-dependent oxidoreductase [Runella rosea]|uniref:FAD-dependent oxidoreductase n=1 Tax=Runella rosea TaxID=2259595 RepID=A0A344TCI6_9BACT|nr:NAD(P)/FAD-dependent oxidoreductase [Runella rosea]AXE16357.1 FAD-dependent oxidoreductase [Runella rosea]